MRVYFHARTSYFTFHEGSLLDSQTHSCPCECLCAVHIHVYKHTPAHTENSLQNTGMTKKNRILHRALWKGFSMILQGAAWRPLICRCTRYFGLLRSIQLSYLHPKFRMLLWYLMIRVKLDHVTNTVFEPQIAHVWKGAFMDKLCKNKDSCDWTDTCPA